MIGYPLDSHVEFDENNIPFYDRAVSSVPLRKLIKKLFSDGVMPNPSTNMQVAAGTGMNVVVKPGFAICNGCMKLEEEQVALSVRVADSSYARIDTVVLRLDDNDSTRSCELAVLTGTPSANPVRPNLTRNKSVWEIGLADIKVSANATSIKNGNITDTRYQTSRCGVISSISEFDTTTLYQQIQDDLKEFQENEKAYFAEWFDEIKDQLSTDAAGNLQNQILVERERINNLARMEDGSIVTDAEKEIADVRVDANGITHPTAGDAVRDQFNKAREQFDEVEKQFDEVHDIRLGADDVVYPTAGEAVRRQIENIQIKFATNERKYEFCPVKLSDIKHVDTSLRVNAGALPTSNLQFGDAFSFYSQPGHCTYDSEVKAGDSIILSNSHDLNSDNPYLFVFDNNGRWIKVVSFDELKDSEQYDMKYTFEQDGYFYICFNYTTAQTGEFFYVKHPSKNEPFVLDAIANYEDDAKMGEATLKAIMEGRNVVVRVPNVSGDNYVATYSPIYMYQLPNRMNDYLYLFYLKDEKQEIDLTALGIGKIEMPIYGQIKLKLARDYNQTPLM